MILPATTRALVAAMRIARNIQEDEGCIGDDKLTCSRPQMKREADELMGLLLIAGNELVELNIKTN